MAAIELESTEINNPAFGKGENEFVEKIAFQEMRDERNTPVREILGQNWDLNTGTCYPPSPLGATPRGHLPQSYRILVSRKGKEIEDGDGFKKEFRKRDEFSKDTLGGNSQSLFTHIKDRFQTPYIQVSLFGLMGIFLVSSVCLGAVFYNFPKFQMTEARYVKIPWNINEAKNLGRALIRYKDRHPYVAMTGFILTYIFLQSFAIPGSLFMSILAGFLFPFPIALVIVSMCTSIGASCCYLLSSLIGHNFIHRLFFSYASKWSKNVKQHKIDLLNYVIFLRIAPFVPNSLINVVSPIIDIPIDIFFTGTFLGVVVTSFVLVQSGTILHNLTLRSTTSWFSILQLSFFAIFSLLPIIFWKKLKEKLD